jgi:hypothetical protein
MDRESLQWHGVSNHRGYIQQPCWPRRGPRMALELSLHRLSMRYDADRRRGVSFSGSENARQELLPPDAIAIGYGCHCGGRVGQSHRHDQEGGVSIVGEAGPRRGRQDPSHQDCCSGSATRRAPEYGHSRRSVVCAPLCTAEPANWRRILSGMITVAPLLTRPRVPGGSSGFTNGDICVHGRHK